MIPKVHVKSRAAAAFHVKLRPITPSIFNDFHYLAQLSTISRCHVHFMFFNDFKYLAHFFRS